jgi:hypothetical protein
MTEPQKLTDLVPVEVLTEVNTAIAVLEIQGPAITEALRQLDRATTMAWKAVNMLGVTDEEWSWSSAKSASSAAGMRPTSWSRPSTCLARSRPLT